VPTNPPIPEEDFVRLRVRLGQLRAERGLTYDALAAQAGVNRSNLVALETGKPRNGKPVQGSLAVWRRIASALGVRFSELMQTLD
jgi:DNA-binding XRE family transcriptional regulator